MVDVVRACFTVSYQVSTLKSLHHFLHTFAMGNLLGKVLRSGSPGLFAAVLLLRAWQRGRAQPGFAAPPPETFLDKAAGVAAACAAALRRALPAWAADVVGLYALLWMRKRLARRWDDARAFLAAPAMTLKNDVGGAGYRLAKRYIPLVRAKVAEEHLKTAADIEGKLKGGLPADVRAEAALVRLPPNGMDRDALLALFDASVAAPARLLPAALVLPVPPTTRRTADSMSLRQIIAGKHCQQCFPSNNAVQSEPARPQGALR